MRKNRILSISLVLILTLATTAQEGPKSFHKYCLITSITAGPGKALYTTRDRNDKIINSEILDSNIDPLVMEFGLTDKIGIGFSRGGENFNVDANKFYKQNLNSDNYGNMMWTSTKYLTLDAAYHFFTSKRLDLSFFTGIGYYKLSGNVYIPNAETINYFAPLYSYNASGGVIRSGTRARWYFSKRWGVMGMMFGYAGKVKEPYKKNSISDANGSGGISTTLIGIGHEVGICFRIGKQKYVKTEATNEKKKLQKIKIEEDNDKEPLISIID